MGSTLDTNILALESSTSIASVALIYKQELFVRRSTSGIKHGEWFLPAIDELFDSAACTLADLHGIAFGQGPGFFAGVRMAASIAHGMSVGASLSVAPICSLQALEWQIQQQLAHDATGTILTMLDARMQQFYCRISKVSQAEQHTTVNLYDVQELLIELANCYGPIWVAGDYAICKNALQASDYQINENYICYTTPCASIVAKLAQANADLFTHQYNKALPCYIRNNVAIPGRT